MSTLQALVNLSAWMRTHTLARDTCGLLVHAHAAYVAEVGNDTGFVNAQCTCAKCQPIEALQARADAVTLDLATDPVFLAERTAIRNHANIS